MKMNILFLISLVFFIFVVKTQEIMSQNNENPYTLYVANSGYPDIDEEYLCDDFDEINTIKSLVLKSIPEENDTIKECNNKKKNNLMMLNSITGKADNIIEWHEKDNPFWLDMNKNGILFIADSANNITLFDTNLNKSITSMSVPDTEPYIISDIYVGHSDENLYLACMGKKPSVKIIDLTVHYCIKTINLPVIKEYSAGQSMSVTANEQTLYVTMGTSYKGKVLFINAGNYCIEKTVEVGYLPYGITITPDGKKLYVANSGSANVSVLDAIKKEEISKIKVGSSPAFIDITPDGSKVIVSNKDDNTVSIIDTLTDTVSSTISVGKDPAGIAISPDGKTAFVANSGSDDVTIIDIVNNKVSGNTIPFRGGHPFDVVVKQ